MRPQRMLILIALGLLSAAPAAAALTPKEQADLNIMREQSRKVQQGVSRLNNLEAQRQAAISALPGLKRQAREASLLAARAEADYQKALAQSRKANGRLNNVTLHYIQTVGSMSWSDSGMQARMPELSQMASASSMYDAVLVYSQATAIMNSMQTQMDRMRSLAVQANEQQKKADAAKQSAKYAKIGAEQAIRTQHQLQAALTASSRAVQHDVSIDQKALASTFNRLLDSGVAMPSVDATALALPGAQRMVMLAVREYNKGVHEEPMGSNLGADIARYRTATQGAVAGGAWCAYFVSYIARRAGMPIGDGGSGLGYVGNITDWGQRVGRFFSPGSRRYRPQGGDIILWSPQHVGLVIARTGSNTVTTIEGNSSDRVSKRTRDISGATGFIRLAGPRLDGKDKSGTSNGSGLGQIN